jgi:ribosome-associated protein
MSAEAGDSARAALRREITEDFVRSSGPGGQNVNKTSTAVKLRFSVENSVCLSDAQKRMIIKKCANRINSDNEIVISADCHREQYLNRKDAFEKLLGMLSKALVRPKRRVKTKPTKASQTRRLESKARHSALKRGRGAASPDEGSEG